MILSLAGSLILAWFAGWLVLSLFGEWDGPPKLVACLQGCLAVGIGLGTVSCLWFGWLVFAGRLSKGAIVLELVLLGSLAVASGANRRQRLAKLNPSTPQPAPANRLLSGLQFAFILACASAVVAHILLTIKCPEGGGYDSWVIWNMRARFLVRGAEQWTCGFSPLLYASHPDYPLLIPINVARLWFSSGAESPLAPALVSSLFTFATVGVLTTATMLMRDREQGLLCGLVLLSTPFFVTHGASQFADVTLGFFILVTLVLFNLHDHLTGRHPRLLIAAGMAAGLAAWTKNEGLLTVMAVLAGRAIATVRQSKSGDRWRQWLYCAAGLLPVLAVVAGFKMSFAPANDLVAGQGWRLTFERLTDLSRHGEVMMAFINRTIMFGNGSLFATPLLAGYFLLVGSTTEEKCWSGAATCLWILAIMSLGFYFTYVTTPHYLTWHLDSSLDRLILQLWPSFLFLFFRVVRTPSEVGWDTQRGSKQNEHAMPESAPLKDCGSSAHRNA